MLICTSKSLPKLIDCVINWLILIYWLIDNKWKFIFQFTTNINIIDTIDIIFDVIDIKHILISNIYWYQIYIDICLIIMFIVAWFVGCFFPSFFLSFLPSFFPSLLPSFSLLCCLLTFIVQFMRHFLGQWVVLPP